MALGIYGMGNIGQSIAVFGAPVLASSLGTWRPVFFIFATPERRIFSFELGQMHVVPYGTIYFNASGNSGGTNNDDVPLFATPSGTDNLSASVRQTRIGIRLQAAKNLGANLNGVIEADFFGGFPAFGVGENFGLVRLRLANVRLDWERTSLIVGQDWMTFAPNNPVSIAVGRSLQFLMSAAS